MRSGLVEHTRSGPKIVGLRQRAFNKIVLPFAERSRYGGNRIMAHGRRQLPAYKVPKQVGPCLERHVMKSSRRERRHVALRRTSDGRPPKAAGRSLADETPAAALRYRAVVATSAGRCCTALRTAAGSEQSYQT